MIPRSKDSFQEYCLRKLGAPVIEINVDEEQVEDRVEEALQFYQTYHYDAIERVVIVYDVTQDDIDNKYVTIPPEILSVTQLVHDGGGFLKQSFGNPLWHAMKITADDMAFGSGSCSFGTSYYTMMMNSMAELEFAFNAKKSLNFNYRNHHLNINTDWSAYNVGDLLALECYRAVDPGAYGDIWADRSLQNYAVALIGCQWGNNLSKFNNVELPGGLTLAGDEIYDKYNDILTKLEEDFSLLWELPVDFMVG